MTTTPSKTRSLHHARQEKLLFTGSERADAIQILLGAAKLNGLNPAEWLADTLEKLPT